MESKESSVTAACALKVNATRRTSIKVLASNLRLDDNRDPFFIVGQHYFLPFPGLTGRFAGRALCGGRAPEGRAPEGRAFVTFVGFALRVLGGTVFTDGFAAD